MVFLLMHACSAEGSRVAVSLLQVRQGLFVQLHGVSGEPAFQLAAPPMKTEASHRSGVRLKVKVCFSHNTSDLFHLLQHR